MSNTNKIAELAPHLADLIAAGEVVERPASAVKELVENALDAGATAVSVEIENGGMARIRVSDNGCGITREDAPRAFLRHATSKLRDERGLEAIGTLGFRGEALAAIAAVSKVELLTQTADDGEGTRLMLEGGVVSAVSPAARAVGTTLTVRDLFYNTPARLKFMKTDRAEGAAVSAAVIRLALSHPEVALRYTKDGAEELHTPGDGRLDSCVYSALGRELALGLQEVASENEGVTVTGYVSKPEELRGSRNNQFFFVNGRHIKSRALQAAVENAYSNQQFKGRFPACVLYIALSPSTVDVNVHPAKTEVKFQYEKRVFDAVYYAALAAVSGDEPHIRVASPIDTLTQPPAELKATERVAPEPARQHEIPPRETMPRETTRIPPLRTSPDIFTSYDGGTRGGFVSRIPAYPEAENTDLPVRDGAQFTYNARPAAIAEHEVKAAPEPQFPTMRDETPPYRVIGETMGVYILVESAGSLWLIDKHAAHERIHFNRLKAERAEVMPQILLSPLAWRIGAEELALLLDNGELLERLGFVVESFGDAEVVVRQIPSDIDLGEAESVLADICDALRDGAIDPEARRDKLLASVACKAAIKAGRSSEPRELEAVAARVMSGEIRFCPHGRPVAVELTKAFLDKSFKRI
ncbi:MAG: DNA mismatch repair endonuclease MutL [Oscillospiraceae bacterium]|nr:DNA mismatch repair endonuclease MutL [Oscillospiraceae bacterium]